MWISQLFYSQLWKNTNMIFKERLKELRALKGLSQKELAAETGLSFSAIGKWEAGVNEPSSQALIVLAKYFDESVDYLLGLTD